MKLLPLLGLFINSLHNQLVHQLLVVRRPSFVHSLVTLSLLLLVLLLVLLFVLLIVL